MIQQDDQTDAEVVERWLLSGKTARISGLDLKPLPHPMMLDVPQSVKKGQATVFFVKQFPHGHIWLLKKFAPSRRPSNAYLGALNSCVPGQIGFFACTQRRLLNAGHLDRRHAAFGDTNLARWLEGTILMPRVPGKSWVSIADCLRAGQEKMTMSQRVRTGLGLAECAADLERGHCSHRDFSGTNTWIDDNCRVYLIDWDCMYHPELPFQPNTSAGTMGYMAPFLRDSAGAWDPKLSWCQRADRFALAVLIAELLLIGPDAAEVSEDGTLFSQSQLGRLHGQYVRKMLGMLSHISKPCADLLERSLRARTFDACPSPDHWRSALRHTAKRLRERPMRPKRTRLAIVPRVRQACGSCGRTVLINRTKYTSLRALGRIPLCRTCLQVYLTARAEIRARQDRAHPQASCEHCLRSFRIPRPKLHLLRTRGKPILCPSCLAKQLSVWETECRQRDRDYPKTACAQCGKKFRLGKAKFEILRAREKAILCTVCLSRALSSTGQQLRAPCGQPVCRNESGEEC